MLYLAWLFQINTPTVEIIRGGPPAEITIETFLPLPCPSGPCSYTVNIQYLDGGDRRESCKSELVFLNLPTCSIEIHGVSEEDNQEAGDFWRRQYTLKVDVNTLGKYEFNIDEFLIQMQLEATPDVFAGLQLEPVTVFIFFTFRTLE